MSEPSETITTPPATKPAPAAPRAANRPAYVPQRGGTPRTVRQIVEEDDDAPFIQRYRGLLIAGAVLAIGIAWVAFRPAGESKPARKASEPQMVKLVLPPPPPPPPPKVLPPPPKEEKRPEQAPEEKPMEKPAEEKPKPVEQPPEGLGTSIRGPGAGMSGLGGGRGNGLLGGTGTGTGGGDKAKLQAWYAGQVQTRVADALRKHPKVRLAAIKGLKFSVQLDATGRVTGIKLAASTGDAALDDAIQNEALRGLQLQEPPPGGKPMTVTMRLTAERRGAN